MKFPALRKRTSLPSLLVVVLCVLRIASVPSIKAQTPPQPAAGSAAQPFDATNLRDSVEIGALGLVQAGDDPAYASPDFDDSKWLPVDAKTPLRGYFPQGEQPVIWRRLRIRVNPTETQVALQAYFISRAFEIYVNGQKLKESGQVEPFVAYTSGARMIAPIPDAQLRTGTLLIAIRARAPRWWWTSPVPGFIGPTLTLGTESALRAQSLLDIIGENASDVLVDLLALGVGLVALALFIAQRNRLEYFWIFLLGTVCALEIALQAVVAMHNLPASWGSLTYLLNAAEWIAVVLVFQAFLRERFSRLLWLFIIAALLVYFALQAELLFGILPYYSLDFSLILWDIVLGFILPWRVWKQMRRGNREASILLIPIFSISIEAYATIAFAVFSQSPPFRSFGNALQTLYYSLHIGIFAFSVDDVSQAIFFISLAVIMVLRFTRTGREQAVLEGEMAAAREVQQVILPEAVEAVPGFKVESVYQPAREVGGDFFQVLPDQKGGLVIVVGDVAGKGLPAAMLVSLLVGAVRTTAAYTHEPAKVLEQLNERLFGRTHGGFATALCAHIEADGRMTIANAGHLTPYLDGREIELQGALPLGVEGSVHYESASFQLPIGSRLTFYSDGVVEAQNQSGELFGFDQAKSFSTQPAAAIVEAAKQFGQEDDITVVTIERLAAVRDASANGTAPMPVPA